MSVSPQPESFLPATIGRYKVLRLLGQGAMSRVFLAYDPQEHQQVAVKVLADHLAGHKQFVNRFYREAMMSMRLRHPRIIRGLESGYDQQQSKHFLVLELVDGPTAAAWLQEFGPFPLPKLLHVGLAICEALQEIHRNGFVHRDVKPENILMDRYGEPKLIDLGLMKRMTGDADLTAVHQGVGTPQYMPYEQSINGALVDARSDGFALAASLYHLATGVLPFGGTSHEELTREKELDAYVPLSQTAPWLPPVLDVILARALARDPRARFGTAKEFQDALSQFARSLSPHQQPSEIEDLLGDSQAKPGRTGLTTQALNQGLGPLDDGDTQFDLAKVSPQGS